MAKTAFVVCMYMLSVLPIDERKLQRKSKEKTLRAIPDFFVYSNLKSFLSLETKTPVTQP